MLQSVQEEEFKRQAGFLLEDSGKVTMNMERAIQSVSAENVGQELYDQVRMKLQSQQITALLD